MKKALLWRTEPDTGHIVCDLCEHYCVLKEGRIGICGVRQNLDGVLYSLNYGLAAARHIDPIEKKPFFHVLPGSRSYSLATEGCNMRCSFCQNWSISQSPKGKTGEIGGGKYPPQFVAEDAFQTGCRSVACTYSEPTIFFEYANDIGAAAHERGLLNLFVTNGYMTREALDLIAPNLDGANVDLKSFSDRTYRKVMGAKLGPTLEFIRRLKELGKWVEVTTLVIPGVNDSPGELRDIARFLAGLDPAIPWHVSKFHPDYKMTESFRRPTPPETLLRARETGLEEGLKYVYTGNVPGLEGENTHCPSCGETAVARFGFSVTENRLRDGRCGRCGGRIDGVFQPLASPAPGRK